MIPSESELHPPMDSLVLVGKVLGAQGLKGALRVRSYTDPEENLFRYQPWVLAAHLDALQTPPPQQSSTAVELLRWHATSKGFVVQCRELSSRDEAEQLRGQGIWVREEKLAATDEDEYYWRDLIGCEVLTEDGRRLGVVTELIATGSKDVLAIGQGTEQTLIPFAERYVLSVSVAEQKLLVDWPEGW